MDKIRRLYFVPVLTTMIFMAGLHQIDTAWNLAYVQEKSPDSAWTDISLTGIERDHNELYRYGVLFVITGFLATVLSLFMIHDMVSVSRKNQEVPDEYT